MTGPGSSLSAKPRMLWLLVYLLMISVGASAFLAVQFAGQRIEHSQAAGTLQPGPMHEQINTLLHVLLALAVVIITARAIGAVFKFLKQPAVIGEVVAGILLGPSLLGAVAPDVYVFLLPPSTAP